MSLDPFALPPSSNSQAEATRTAADLPPPPPDRTDSKPEDLATFTAAASTSSHSHFEHASASNGHAHAGENGTTDSNGLTAADVVDEDRKPDLPPPFPFASTSKAVLDAPEPTSADGPLSPRGGASRRSVSAAASGSRNGDHGPGSRVGSVKSGSSTPKLEGIGDDDDVKPITTTTTTTPRAKGKKKKVEESVPQFIGDLPLAEEEVRACGLVPESANEKLTSAFRVGGLCRLRGPSRSSSSRRTSPSRSVTSSTTRRKRRNAIAATTRVSPHEHSSSRLVSAEGAELNFRVDAMPHRLAA